MSEIPASLHAEKKNVLALLHEKIQVLVHDLLHFAKVGGLGTLDRTPGSPPARHYAFDHHGDSYSVFIVRPEEEIRTCVVHVSDGQNNHSLVLKVDERNGLEVHFKEPDRETIIGLSEDEMAENNQIVAELIDGLTPIFAQELANLEKKGILAVTQRVQLKQAILESA